MVAAHFVEIGGRTDLETRTKLFLSRAPETGFFEETSSGGGGGCGVAVIRPTSMDGNSFKFKFESFQHLSSNKRT